MRSGCAGSVELSYSWAMNFASAAVKGILAVGIASAPSSSKVMILVNGERISDGILIGGRSYAPVRALSEALGAYVKGTGELVFVDAAPKDQFDKQLAPLRLDGLEIKRDAVQFVDYDDKLPGWAPGVQALSFVALEAYDKNGMARRSKRIGNKDPRNAKLMVMFIGNWTSESFNGSTTLITFETVQFKNGTFGTVPSYLLHEPTIVNRDDKGGFNKAVEGIMDTFFDYWGSANGL